MFDDSERHAPDEERDDTPESVRNAIKGHGDEGRDASKSTPEISEEGEHGQTQVSGDPGEPPDQGVTERPAPVGRA